jgi:hypothetical protein
MPDLIDKTEQVDVPESLAFWDPFRLLRELLRWAMTREARPRPAGEGKLAPRGTDGGGSDDEASP